jgi:hypothetical protein
MWAAALLAWKRADDRTKDLILVCIVGSIVSLIMIGYLEATDVDFRPYSFLRGALTAEIGDNGLPYIAIDLEALGQNENEPTTASGHGEVSKDGKSGSSPILLFPVGNDLFTFGGDVPRPGTDHQPSPDPQPTPGHSPSPSPSATPSPSPSREPSPSAEPSPEPSPSAEPSPEPSPSAEPSPEPSPSAEPSPEPSPSAEPSPEPSP